MEIIESQEEQKPRLIDNVKAVVNWFEWSEFTVPDLIDAMEAHGHTNYNKGALKSAVLSTLIRTGYIKQIHGRDAVTYQRVERKYKQPQPPRRQRTPTDRLRDEAPKKRRPNSVAPMQAVMIATARPMMAKEVMEEIEAQTSQPANQAAIYSLLYNYVKRGWLDAKKVDYIKRKPKAYNLTAKFFIDHQKDAAKIAGSVPALKDRVDARFTQLMGSPDGSPDEAKTAPDEAAATPQKARQNPNAPIDWNLEENYISAADVGAAIIEHVRRLELTQIDKFSAESVGIRINEMQYKIEEQTARVAAKIAKIKEKDQAIKNLKIELDAAKKEAEIMRVEATELRVRLNAIDPRTVKKSFKMSEVVHLKKLFKGEGENEKNGLVFEAVGG